MIALAPRTVQNMPDCLSLPIMVLQPLRFYVRNGCNAECIVTQNCAAEEPRVPNCELDDLLILQVRLHRIIVGPLPTTDPPLEL